METKKKFPAPSSFCSKYEEWQKEAVLALKVSDPSSIEEKLYKSTYEKFKLKPLYDASDVSNVSNLSLLSSNCSGHTNNEWRVAEDYGVVTTAKMEEIYADIEKNGVDEIHLNATSPAFPYFLSQIGKIGNKTILLNPHHELKKLVSLIEMGDELNASNSKAKGSLGFDPLAFSHESFDFEMPLLLKQRSTFPQWRLMTASGVSYHEYGASETLELAYTLATAVSYARALEKAGTTVKEAFELIDFRLSLTPEFFLSVAKVRALDALWQQVKESCGITEGISEKRTEICVQTSRRHLTTKDPWINILRGTTTAWAGAIGGATSIVVLPFDAMLGERDLAAKRLAINTQLILKEESHLGKVADPANGSYFLESLTHELMQSAYEHFQKIEAAGGMEVWVREDYAKNEMDAIYLERMKNVAKRKEGITGVSEYPLLNEAIISRASATASSVNSTVGPLFALRRVASPFEALRIQSDEFLKVNGSRPKIIMVTLGALSQHFARSHFTQNFLEVGGFEVITIEGEKGKEAIDAVLTSTPSISGIVVLSAPDALYLSDGARLLETVRSSKHTRKVIVAGRIQEAMKDWQLDGSLFMGCDVVATLKQLWGEIL